MTNNYLKPKSHFLDTLKTEILPEANGFDTCEVSCECCGYYLSAGQVQVTDERDQSSADLYLCKDCFVDTKRKKDDNLMNIYSISQVKK